MVGLRHKLLLGFGGLLLILMLVSGVGIAVSMQHRQELDRFVYDNWRSVEYGQNMVNDLDRLDDVGRRLVATEPGGTSAALAAAGAPDSPAALALADFQKNLAHENENITLPGEDRLAHDLTVLWNGENGSPAISYSGAYRRLLDPAATSAVRAAAYEELSVLSPRVKSAAQKVISLNFDNMKPIDGRVKAMSDRANQVMLLLTAVGVAVAAIFIVVMRRSILIPIQTLTRSAREIEAGNLDLVVQARSRDELGQLAEAFNSMAAKLREFRRTNRAKLLRTQQTTQLAIDSLPDAVAILSPEGIVEMANASAQRLFSLRPDSWVSSLNIDWLVDLFQRAAETLQRVEPRGYESAIQVLDEGGAERFFLPHALPILDEDRQLLGVTVVLADVTNLRRLDEMKSGMISVVSHELRTPLTSIRMGVHLLLEERVGPLTPKQSDLLVTVSEDSDRLNSIVENLLDIGRIEAGRALFDLKPASAEELVSQATDEYRAAFIERGVELHVDIPPDVPRVMVDRSRIGHVFSNLLSNALKFTEPGGQVKVSASAQDESVKFSVEDTGTGIPRQYLEKVFERFFRVPGQTGSRGAGLGLAIAREIVEAHGGHIAVATQEGVGSTFSFTLERAKEGAAKGHDQEAVKSQSAAGARLVPLPGAAPEG